jgi:hypothetical protein
LVPLPGIEKILASQDTLITSMAGHLESLAAHYDQMAGALRESEAGEAFSEEDLQGWCVVDSIGVPEFIFASLMVSRHEP